MIHLIQLPRHKGSLTLTHNSHRDDYLSVKEHPCGDPCWDRWDWISKEERKLAIATDSIWEIQWYPDTPVSSISYAASDLYTLLEYVKDME